MEGSHNYSNNKKQLGFVLSPEINVDEYISLRLPSTEDAKMLFKSVEENRFYLREWLPWVDSIVSLQDEINFILTSRKNHIQGDSGLWLIIENNHLIGALSLNWIDWNNNSCGIGYWISQEKSGNGIITSSCRSLINHLIENNNLHRFVIEAGINNIASRKVAENLGMRLEGINKDRAIINEKYVDHAMYAITAPEWNELYFPK